ncbi:MAG: MBL fold metallo-hydrolase [Deltaproteobacteria bacterium]|nr:MBL fold metallo-hydrolase [Deltaproteobacteria bacterium]
MPKKSIALPGDIKILFHGFPGRAERGYLGWSSVILVNRDKKILFDTGNWGDREELIRRLQVEGIELEDIDIVILSHLHFDHSINLPLFKRANIILSKTALEYASRNSGDLFVPEFMGDYLHSIQKRLTPIEGDTKLDEKITLLETPGHTPGSISCLLEYGELSVILAGDAIKNAYEFVSGTVDISEDREVSKNTIEKIKEVADIIIPGHDRPFYSKDGKIFYLCGSEFEFMARCCPYNEEWTKFKIGFGV